MTLRRGAANVVDVRRGPAPVQRIMRGSTVVWSRSNDADQFERDDSLTLGNLWIQGGNGNARTGVVSGTARTQVPAYPGTDSPVNSRNLWGGAAALSDNMFSQVTVAAKNSQSEPVVSTVGVRLNKLKSATDDANPYDSGVFGYLSGGQLSIWSLIGNSFTQRTGFTSSFEPGDRIRLEAVGQRYSLKRNDTEVTFWLDNTGASGAPLVPIGANYRHRGFSTAVITNGFGYARYSASLADWESGLIL